MSRKKARQTWRGRDIIRRVLEREAAGQAVHASAVLKDDARLLSAAEWHFGGWAATLRAAGIDPDKVSRRRIWTPGRIVRRIHELADQGTALNHLSVKRADSGLAWAGYKHFGSWDEALRAAGYDPMAVRRAHPHWTRAAIIEVIRRRMAAGLPVVAHRMVPKSVPAMGKRLFGSWRAALLAAGVPGLAPLASAWSKSAVVRRILELEASGSLVTKKYVCTTQKDLCRAGVRLFGSWTATLRAAGVDIEAISHRRVWTKDRVIRAIRALGRRGVPLNCKSVEAVERGLWHAGYKRFGSWSDALRAAGYDPQPIGHT